MNPSKAEGYKALIEKELQHVINRTSLAIGSKFTGKVRDVYSTPTSLLLVTTDRLSAFDRLLACIPFKGYEVMGGEQLFPPPLPVFDPLHTAT